MQYRTRRGKAWPTSLAKLDVFNTLSPSSLYWIAISPAENRLNQAVSNYHSLCCLQPDTCPDPQSLQPWPLNPGIRTWKQQMFSVPSVKRVLWNFPVSTRTDLASRNWYVLNLNQKKKKSHQANEIQGSGTIKDEFYVSGTHDKAEG